MTDLLTRAWELLKPGERPEGMEWTPGGPTNFADFNAHATVTDTDYRHLWMWGHAAYDRLCQAVENVLYDLGLRPAKIMGKYLWGRDGNCGYEEDAWVEHTDRLTAAVLALEAERGANAK